MVLLNQPLGWLLFVVVSNFCCFSNKGINVSNTNRYYDQVSCIILCTFPFFCWFCSVLLCLVKILFPYNVMFKINYIVVDGNVSEVGDNVKGLKPSGSWTSTT